MSAHVLRLVLLAAAAIGMTASAACRPNTPAVAGEPEGHDAPLRIVATIRPLELIVRELLDDPDLADRVEISTIMAPEVSPHGFEPTPAQMARLRRAHVLVYNGFGLDDWAVRDLPRTTRAVCFADVADVGDGHHHHHHHHDHEHGPDCNHGPVDEHFWVDPELVGAFAAAVALTIGRALEPEADDPMEVMEAALSRFNGRIRQVDSELARSFSMHKGRRIVTHHNVFSRLTERYGLGDPIVLRPLAVLEPTPGDLRRAIEAIRAENIRVIFVEPQFSKDSALRIRDETGVRLQEVDPLGGNARSWSDMMLQLGDAIAQGLRQ